MHEKYMHLAIAEALKGKNKTYKNPLVGAVIVNQDEIIAKGAHLQYGAPHAEVNAIQTCPTPEKLVHSTLYVTLEPCHHFGKQPPCTQAIIQSGIKKVVIGQLDPNPLVQGKGIAALKQAGVEVIILEGKMGDEVKQLNPFYNFFYTHQRPFVTIKQAITIDGKLSVRNHRTPITDKHSLTDVQAERGKYQAILIGSETALVDNPLLSSSNADYPPVRIVLDRRGRLYQHLSLQLFTTDFSPVYLFTEQDYPASLPQHVVVFKDKQWTIEKILQKLAKQGLQSVFVEGGSTIFDAFLAADKIDQLISYVAPILLGGDALPTFTSLRSAQQAQNFQLQQLTQLEADIKMVFLRG